MYNRLVIIKYLCIFVPTKTDNHTKYITMKLSINYQNRVKKEIENTNRKLNKELNYSKDLQNQSRLAELRKHINHLNNMLK